MREFIVFSVLTVIAALLYFFASRSIEQERRQRHAQMAAARALLEKKDNAETSGPNILQTYPAVKPTPKIPEQQERVGNTTPSIVI
jgi:hypothetical protein